MIPGNLPSNFHGSQVLLQSLCVGFSLCFAQVTEEIILQWNRGENTSVVSSVTCCALICKKKLAGRNCWWFGWVFSNGNDGIFNKNWGEEKCLKLWLEMMSLLSIFCWNGRLGPSFSCRWRSCCISKQWSMPELIGHDHQTSTQSSIGNGRGNVPSFQQKC